MKNVNLEKLRAEMSAVEVEKPPTEEGSIKVTKNSYSSPWRLFTISTGSIFLAELYVRYNSGHHRA